VTDSKLRELERRWKETGSVEDEARYLLERVRVGDLEREKLALAAYCGHEGARIALGDDAPNRPSDLEEWARGLGTWGKEICVRLAIVVARRAQVDETPENLATLASTAIASAEVWLECPCDSHASTANRVAMRVVLATTNLGNEALSERLWAAAHAAYCASAEADPGASVADAVRAAAWLEDETSLASALTASALQVAAALPADG